MKNHKHLAILGLAPLLFSNALLAQTTEPIVTKNIQISCERKSPMTAAEQIKQLKPPKSPAELLQQMRVIHDNFFLLDPAYIDDANLRRLFGALKQENLANQHTQKIDTWKRIKPLSKPPLDLSMVNLHFSPNSDGELAGSFYLYSAPSASKYTAELIEQYFLPDVKGFDPFSFEHMPFINENFDAAGRRPLATHPKGYFVYEHSHQVGACKSKIYLRLHKDGTLWDFTIDQRTANQTQEQRGTK